MFIAVKNTLLGAIVRVERILTLCLNTTMGPVHLVSAYAPRHSANPEIKDKFYDELASHSFHSTNCDTDHSLFCCRVKLQPKNIKKRPPQVDSSKAADPINSFPLCPREITAPPILVLLCPGVLGWLTGLYPRTALAVFVVAHTQEHLKTLLDQFTQACQDFSLTISLNKTKTMAITINNYTLEAVTFEKLNARVWDKGKLIVHTKIQVFRLV